MNAAAEQNKNNELRSLKIAFRFPSEIAVVSCNDFCNRVGKVGLAGTRGERQGPFLRVTTATPVPGTHRRRIRSTARIAVTATRLSISNFNPIALPNLMTLTALAS